MKRSHSSSFTIRNAALSAAALLLPACAPVVSVAPVGEKPAVLKLSEWNGEWISVEDLGENQKRLRLSVADSSSGVLRVEMIEEENSKVFPAFLREINAPDGATWIIANALEADMNPSEEGEANGEPERYFWARIALRDKHILLWGPDADAVREMVAKGVLPGKATDSLIELDRLGPEHLPAIIEAGGRIMNWDQPAIWIRADGINSALPARE